MDFTIVAQVKYQGRTKLVSLNESVSYDEFLGHISGTWVELNSHNISCSFCVGSVVDCFLGCDADLKNLVFLCKHTSQSFVVVDVIKIVPDFISSSNCRNVNPTDQCSPPSTMDDQLSPQNSDPNFFTEPSQFEKGEKESCSTVKEKCVRKRKVRDVLNETEFTGIGSIPSYDVCPIEKKKPLLSDSWALIMKDGIGLEFSGGAVEFREELIKYVLKIGYPFKYVRNDSRYIHAACKNGKESKCDWYIKAKRRPTNDHFVVYDANLVHSCVGSLVTEKKSRLSASIISSLVIDKVKSNPTISGKNIMQTMHIGYGFDIPYWKAWQSIDEARSNVFGGYYESYDQLRWYCEAIKRTNPGSLAEIQTNSESNHFERLFISFKACMDGFRHCRPMIFVDGTFMKGRAKGTMLTATAKDGDNGLFPIAFGIVSAETKENWKWFLEMLRDFIIHDKQIMYISDRNPGLMSAFNEVFHTPVHFYCLYHLLQNLKTRFSSGWTTANRDELSDLFKECAYAPTRTVFHEKIAAFIELGGNVAEEWIEEMPYEKWAVSYSPNNRRYGEMTSNAAESFNSWISEARCMPITFIIDSIRSGLSRWFVERRNVSSKWTGALCASKEALWHHQSDISKTWKVIECPNRQFEVISKVSVSVDLLARYCSCHQWQIRGFPCAHAVAVIRKHCTSAYDYIEECYLASSYRDCYKVDLRPVPETERFQCTDLDEDSRILPPILPNPPGRPKKKRVRGFTEWRKTKPSCCTRCGKTGRHDTFTCSLR